MKAQLGLHALISKRLDYFSHNGLRSQTNFKSKVDRLEDLNIDPVAFNRVLFSLLSGILQSPKTDVFIIETKNCSKYFSLSLSCKRGSFLPPQNGIFSPHKQLPESGYWNAVLATLRESGGNLTFSKLFLHNEIRLQIPLTFQSESHKTTGPLEEGFFFAHAKQKVSGTYWRS